MQLVLMSSIDADILEHQMWMHHDATKHNVFVPMLLTPGDMWSMATSSRGGNLAWRLSPLCKVAIAVSLGVSRLV